MKTFAELPLPPHVRAAVEDFKARLLRLFGQRLELVKVFGSQVRGEAREDSDVDVLVVLDHAGYEELRQTLDLTCEILADYDLLIDPHIEAAERYRHRVEVGWPLIEEIEKDGVLV